MLDYCSTDTIKGAVVYFHDPRVKQVRRETNGVVAAARDTGVNAATDDLIAFHDSDDICLVDRFEQSIRRLNALPDDYIGVYSARLIYNEVTPDSYSRMATYIRPFPHETPLEGDLAARTMRDNIINFPTLLVKAVALRAAGYSHPLLRKNVDWDLALRLTRQGKFGFIPEPLILTPTSLDPDVSANRVSRSQRQGARSYVRITGKLRRAGLGGTALAKHYTSAGIYLMRVDRPRFARKFLRAALALTPVMPKLWAHYLLSFAPGLHAKVRQGPEL